MSQRSNGQLSNGQSSKGLWRDTPPAIFPPVLGLFGVGLGWRRASEVLGAPDGISEMILGAVSLVFLTALVAYLAKVVRKPSIVLEDLQVLSGRAGLATGTMSMMLFAAVLVPYTPDLARLMLVLALVAHALLAVLVFWVLVTGPAERRRVTPVWLLTFVGFIAAPIAAVPLGWSALSAFIFAATLPIIASIQLLSLLQFARQKVPAPLRPLLAIHLASLSLFGITSQLLGYEQVALVFFTLASTLFVLFVLSAFYLTAAGFSPFWGAFTFPLASYGNLLLLRGANGAGIFGTLGGIELVLATLVVVAIAGKIIRLWRQGKLARMTSAASI
ncbi:tellurium resistance protein [Candidatus Halocynthiibacter alkanivorans]|uniref:SLAC1 family transporter n=1 Tax=Candidatus Halocynthiibacter alkanivorans TaxID=2267619 RepID=UPI000DF25367|nr:tellurium resistance protein [Candidatus Halocynthiibacter alkanivorans]